MTKRLIIVLVAVILVLLAIAIYILFLMPTERVYNGVLIDYGMSHYIAQGY